jgi:uncharacterized protein
LSINCLVIFIKFKNMDDNQVRKLMNECNLPDSCNNSELRETHISWVILTDNYAFKIKRPVKYTFLDFSSLEKRKFFCHEEMKLNKRVEPDMYLAVLPITENLVIKETGNGNGIIDYTVKMKRMDQQKEMDEMLGNDEVSETHINALAKKVAEFHKSATVVKNVFGTLEFQENYADIENQGDYISKLLGKEYKEIVDNCIDKSFNYLNANRSYSNERVISGFHRDCHGDLNVRNIFLYDDPVIFDCIEFNSDFRQIDVLNDIAFLCVDLDFYGKEDFSEMFYKKYLKYSGLNDDPKMRELFQYYKSYRANVRAKVTVISAKQMNENENEKELNDVKKFIELMAKYMR